MTRDEIELLKRSSGKTVEFLCTDGEIVQASVRWVSDEDNDLIHDLVSSNMPERYRDRENCAYLTPFEQIESVRVVTE
jgi:hypothetical protein